MRTPTKRLTASTFTKCWRSFEHMAPLHGDARRVKHCHTSTVWLQTLAWTISRWWWSEKWGVRTLLSLRLWLEPGHNKSIILNYCQTVIVKPWFRTYALINDFPTLNISIFTQFILPYLRLRNLKFTYYFWQVGWTHGGIRMNKKLG